MSLFHGKGHRCDSVAPQRVLDPFSIPTRHYASTSELIWLVLTWHLRDSPTLFSRNHAETNQLTLTPLSQKRFSWHVSRSHLQSQFLPSLTYRTRIASAFYASDFHRDNHLSPPLGPPYSSVPPFLQRSLPFPHIIPSSPKPPIQNANRYRNLKQFARTVNSVRG